MKYIKGWEKQLQQHNIDIDWGYFSQGAIVHNDKAILPLGCTGSLLELDLLTDNTRVMDVSFCDELNGIGGIAEDKDGIIWVSSRNETNPKLIAWNKTTNAHKTYLFSDTLSKTGAYYAPIITDNGVLILPETMDHTYFYGFNNNQIQISAQFDEIINPYGKSMFFGASVVAIRRIDQMLYFFTTTDYAWNEYNLNTCTNIKNWLPLNDDCKNEYKNMMKNKFAEGEIIMEGNTTLSYFLGIL